MSADNSIDWLDESFTHQIVAPKRVTAITSPRWAERAYFVVSLPEGGLFNAGRQLYAQDGRRFGFIACRQGDTLDAWCGSRPYTPGDDPDDPTVGPLRFDVLEPMRRLRVAFADPGPISVDVTFDARLRPVQTDVNRIEREGRVVTEYMNIFQSGLFNGRIEFDGKVTVLKDRPGFRDRGWGLRAHEGAPRRGFGFTLACELPDRSLYLFLYETASGRRSLTNGWLIGEGDLVDAVVDVEHDLRFNAQHLAGGICRVRLASGRELSVGFDADSHLYLSAVGYRREGHTGLNGRYQYDLRRPDVVASLAGQTDAAVRVDVAGVSGVGFCEVGLGIHARYRPETKAN